MIAIDCQLFLIVQNEGFTRLLNMLEPMYSLQSRRYIMETVLPRIVDSVTAEVRKAIAGVPWFSFTTDVWSTDVTTPSSASLHTG